MKAWEALATSMFKGRTVLLHGPCGCGKSEGVRDLCGNTLGRCIYEINPSFEQDATGLLKEMQRACQTKTLVGACPNLLLIDDVDGFGPIFLSTIVQFVTRNQNGKTPVVMICTDPYMRELKPLDTLQRIRLFEPSRKASLQILKSCLPDATQSKVDAYYTIAKGNLHRLKVLYSTIFKSTPDNSNNMFEGTRRLLVDGDTTSWMQSADESCLIRILHENIPTLNKPTIEFAFVEACDALSRYDSQRGELRMEVLGLEAHLSLQNFPPSALCLPKRAFTSSAKNNSYDIPELLQASQA